MPALSPARVSASPVSSISGEEDFQEIPKSLHKVSQTYQLDRDEPQFSVPRKPVTAPAIDYVPDGKEAEQFMRSDVARNEPPEIVHSHSLGLLGAWWLEALSCLLFLLALVAIVVTIYPHQGRPLPQWPYNISVNSLIAIYAVILKATMLLVVAEGLSQLKWSWFGQSRPLNHLTRYDMASRGAWGAVRLLWTLRGRNLIASVGAIVTIAALAIDPFAQQIIRYYTCEVEVTSNRATIPRTNLFYEPGLHESPLQISLSSGIRSAVNGGVFQPGVPIQVQCATGNCTFSQPYHSMGYCSHCLDVTHELQIHNQTHHYTPPNTNQTEDGYVLNTTLPSGLFVACGVGTEDFIGNEYFSMGPSPLDGSIEVISGACPSFYDLFGRGKCAGSQHNDTWYCRGYGAARCTLEPCIRTYTSRVSAGNLQEDLLSTSSDLAESNIDSVDLDTLLAAVDIGCISAHERQSLIGLGYSISNNTRWLPYNQTFAPFARIPASNDTRFPESMLVRGCVYLMDVLNSESLYSWFSSSVFSGNVTVYPDESFQPAGYIGSDILQNFFHFGNVSFERVNSTFQNVSDSITKYVRENGNANHSAPAIGVVLHDQTCVRVRWWWLAFPVALVALTIFFLAAMIVETRRKDHPKNEWKSSPLPLVFRGLQLDTHGPGEEDIHEMERTARHLHVRLDGRTGWKFTEGNQPSM